MKEVIDGLTGIACFIGVVLISPVGWIMLLALYLSTR